LALVGAGFARVREEELTRMTWPATTIILVVSPSLDPDGGKAYSTRGQLFDGSIDGRRIAKRSTARSSMPPGYFSPRASTRPPSWSCGTMGRPMARCGRPLV
jgi:hypothetical protein